MFPHGWEAYIEIQADKPKASDKRTLRINSSGNLVNQQTEKLEGPLQSRKAFLVQAFYDDSSNAQKETDESEE
jgi:hypothetical protein